MSSPPASAPQACANAGVQQFEVEEVFTDHEELIVLSLGFASPDDPLDVLHLACGRSLSGTEPRPVEDLLYLERTDQDLACTGAQVQRLAWEQGGILLALTPEGAQALGLGMHTRFCFNTHPELADAAAQQLAAMAALGHAHA